MNIRKATKEDIDQIANVWEELHDYNVEVLGQAAVYRGKSGWEERYKNLLQDIFNNAESLVVVAEDEGKIVGFVNSTVSNMFGDGPQHAYIDNTIIIKEYRGKGIGKKLYEYLENIFREQGVEGVTTDIFDNNDDSVKFHERLGYKKISKAIEMYKKL